VKAVHAYFAEIQVKEFKWGVHDCFTFTNEVFRRLHGTGWADDWAGRYMVDGRPMTRPEMLAEFGVTDFADAANQKLRRVGNIPPRGSLVALDRSPRVMLGICDGTHAAFLGDIGLRFFPIEKIDGAWIK
jgi:hypothetical protein